MFNGLIDLPVWGYVVITLVFTHITIAAVTIYLHRHQAHRALELHPIVSHFFRFWLWLTTGMETKAWAAIHRKHHARCETEQDPHSPQVMGLRKVLLEGAELYRLEAKNQDTLDKYGFGTPDDWMERNVYSKHSRLGIGSMFLINVLLFGPVGITIWAVQMLWIPLLAAGVINGIGHFWGYRNYETEDAATNIVPWGILIGGEELHNNHHAFSSSAKLSSKPWEFDIGWMYIRILEICGLAQVKKVAPKPLVVSDKTDVDKETVKLLVTHRLYVMADYCRDVIAPALHEEFQRARDTDWRRLLKRNRKLLVRDENLMDERAKCRLSTVLESSQTLKTVYQYKLQLQDLWNRSLPSADLVQAVQEWCRQAEASGVKQLQDFAHTLRGYTVPQVRA